jgi:YVTN family beta-propeller protein
MSGHLGSREAGRLRRGRPRSGLAAAAGLAVAGAVVAVPGAAAAAATTAPSAYVANQGNGTVTPIDTATNTAGTPIPVGIDPDAIAIVGG